MSLIYILIIGAVSGWLAGQIMKGGGFGLLWNIILGIVGSFVGDCAKGCCAAGLSLGRSRNLWCVACCRGSTSDGRERADRLGGANGDRIGPTARRVTSCHRNDPSI